MAIKLGDDGTLDTVLYCEHCREEFRYNFAESGIDADEPETDDGDAYDQFVAWAIEDATENHVCEETEGE